MNMLSSCQQINRLCRIIAENTLECIWTYDIQTDRFTFVSPSVLKLIGYTVGEAMQASLADFLPPGSLQQVRDMILLFADRYRSGERREEMLSHRGDYELLCRDRTAKQVEITAKLIFNEETGSLELLGVTQDVTRRKQLELQLNQALENKNEMIQRLRNSETASKSLAEELHEKNRILLDYATKDSLTGACNRYFFDQKLSEEENRSRRRRHPISVVFFDVDGFKEINDTIGHQTGDKILVHIVDIVKQNIRAYDTLARWGGDEFILLMPQTALAEAEITAEKIRQKIETIVSAGAGAAITASFGVVEIMQGESTDSWFRRVDYALFRSKNGGRNRVTAMEWESAVPFVQIRLEWKNEWECGNAVVDGQHKTLVAMGNRLLDAALADMSSPVTARALEELGAHVQAHFESEESILREYAYPGVEEHARIHASLIQQVNALLKRHREDALKPTAIFSFLLDEVVTGHLLKEDIRFFPYLRQSTPPARSTDRFEGS